MVHHGIVHIQASFNNTIITVTDAEGSVIAWSSAGGIGFKGSRKGTPFAATQAAINAGQGAKAFGVRSVEVRVKGPGAGAGIRHSGAANICGTSSEVDPGCHPDSPQRVSTSETAKGLRRTERAWRDTWVLCAACVGGKG